MSLDTELGGAYKLAVLETGREAAIAGLKDWLAENPGYRAESEAFVAAHSDPEIAQRCFITRTRLELLKAALA